MNRHLLHLALLVCACCPCAALKAQDSAEVDKEFKAFVHEVDSLHLDRTIFALLKKSYFEAGLSYLSNNVYLGRKDTARLPYLIPSISYVHKSGLFATAAVAYYPNTSNGRIDLVTLQLGYLFAPGKFSGMLSTSEYFYNSQSTNVASAIQTNIAFQGGYDLGFIRPMINAFVNFSTRTDFQGAFGLEHTFYALHDHLDFTPTFLINASTQNYYNDYYENKRYTSRHRSRTTRPTFDKMSATVLDASSFKVLDYEVSLPIFFREKQFTFYFVPTYSIPVHPAVLTFDDLYMADNTRAWTASEQIQNTFYWTLGVVYRF